jgi:hypothetical protein
MRDIVTGVQEALAGASSTTECIFNINDVKAAISRPKAHKSDGSSEFSSDHDVNTGNDFCTHVACLFTAVVVHGMVLDSFRLSTIVPIPKGRNANMSDCANFRGIALSSIYGKLCDNIILDRFHHKLMSCDVQFKAKCSTNMCSMILHETIACYVQNQNRIFLPFWMPLRHSISFIIASYSSCLLNVNCQLVQSGFLLIYINKIMYV